MAELIGGSGYDDVQATEPSNPSIGDTWLDTNPNGDEDSVGKIYADLGNGTDWQVLPVQDELQSGRTRELLMLLQDKPIPEVVDPMNIQSGLSSNFGTDSNGDYVITPPPSTADNTDPSQTQTFPSDAGLEINPNTDIVRIDVLINPNAANFSTAYILDSNFNIITQKDVSSLSGGGTITFSQSLTASNSYYVSIDNGGSDYTQVRTSATSASFPFTSEFGDITNGYISGDTNSDAWNFDQVTFYKEQNTALVTDQFASPTTEPADFKQWNAIRARDVTVGGSTSADPVEFEILDSTDTVLNGTRIPKARIADEPFVMRNRVYSEDAGSNGQSDFTIATTGDGGHFGIPVLTVVSVKKNGSVIDSANWSFDPDTDTVTIDTSNVTIANGDTVDIKYDFDVFDTTLQPRAYLNRESTSETSPSISHFRYEYVI